MTSTRNRREGADDGYALVTVIMISTALLALVLVVFATVDGATGGVARDARTKEARAAADAGVAFYTSRLAADPDYWKNCGSVGGDPVFSGTQAPVWRSVERASSDAPPAAYTIELLPARSGTACSTSDPTTTIDPQTNTVRIKVTGQVGTGSRAVRRTVTAGFRRGSLLQYLYFTDRETTDWQLYPAGTSTGTQGWAQTQCIGVYGVRSTSCSDIQFGNDDAVNGPLHTNDTVLSVCGGPRLGRPDAVPPDKVESTGLANGTTWRRSSGCGLTTSQPERLTQGSTIKLPDDIDATLKQVAQGDANAYYRGRTTITFNGSSMSVARGSAAATTVALPPKGVIYVDDNGCAGTASNPANLVDYSVEEGSATTATCRSLLRIQGTINQDLTIASAGDVVVTGDVRAGAAKPLIGLVAKNFVRVRHPITLRVPSAKFDTCQVYRNYPGLTPTCPYRTRDEGTYKKASYSCGSGTFATCRTDRWQAECVNAAGFNDNVRIDGAILALNHGFTVDNYACTDIYSGVVDTDLYAGTAMNELAVEGAIIQKFRGPVGTAAGTGYTKNYLYDDRLRVRNPPYFPQPQDSLWRVVRSTETLPPATPAYTAPVR